jgi:hypothetical protein
VAAPLPSDVFQADPVRVADSAVRATAALERIRGRLALLDERLASDLREAWQMLSEIDQAGEGGALEWLPATVVTMADVHLLAADLITQVDETRSRAKRVNRVAGQLSKELKDRVPAGAKCHTKRHRLQFVLERSAKIARTATLMTYWEIGAALEVPCRSRADFDRRVATWNTFLRDHRARSGIK